MCSSDHAPHSAEEKSRGLKGSFFGIVGLESAFGLMYTHLVKTGVLTIEQLVALMVVNPRKRFGCENPLQEGDLADMVVMEVKQPYTIDSATFVSKGKAQPFDGYEVVGKPLATLYQGEAVWQHTELCQIKM